MIRCAWRPSRASKLPMRSNTLAVKGEIAAEDGRGSVRSASAPRRDPACPENPAVRPEPAGTCAILEEHSMRPPSASGWCSRMACSDEASQAGSGVSSSSMNRMYSPRASRNARLRALESPSFSSRTIRTATPAGRQSSAASKVGVASVLALSMTRNSQGDAGGSRQARSASVRCSRSAWLCVQSATVM